MSTLLVDIGNSRLKWTVLRRGRLGRMRALERDGAGARALRELLDALPADLDRAVAVSVVHNGIVDRLAAALSRSHGVELELVATTRRAAGVTCGYREPWRLGADRWVAVIGAHHLHERPRATCVVDVGTALTIDLVDRDGRHHGGAIVPAPATMVASLLQGTSGIAVRSGVVKGKSRDRNLYARDTRQALEQGAWHAAAAVIERGRREARKQLGRRVELVLTGGGAPGLLPYLDGPAELVPDLVLRGLAALCPAAPG